MKSQAAANSKNMQIVLLIILSLVSSSAVVWGTQLFLTSGRQKRHNLILLILGVLLCSAASVVIDCVIQGGKPGFYYHTHRPGRATVKVFCCACFIFVLFYTLILMIIERKKQRKTIFRWMFRSFLIGMCGAVIIEIGYFNFRHFELIGTKAPEISISADRVYCAGMYFNRAVWKFLPYGWDSAPEFFVYANYSKIRNAAFEFGPENPLNTVEFKFDDSAHRRMESIGSHNFIPGISRSYNVPFHTVGVTNTISMTVLDAEESWQDGVTLKSVTLNQIVQLELDPVRFFICFLVIFALSSFWTGSPLWSLPLDLHNFAQAGAVLLLLSLVILFFGWTVFSSYAGSGNSINDQKSAITENYQQYDKLVDALEAHRYALLETPHHYLEKDGDPYDMKLREERQYDYLWDTAYYNGQYYVYFGVVPAVVVLLPFKQLTGEYLALDYPILVFSVLFLIGIYGIYSLLVKRCFPKISFGLYWAGLFLLVTSLNLTWCLRRTLVYELAITSGICFAVWGLFFVLLSANNERLRPVCFFLSGTFSAFAVGCRPTMIFVSIPVFVSGFCLLKSDEKMLRVKNVFIFLLPYLLIGAALMKYNYERFDDPLEFGITYQLTTENRAAGFPLLGPYGRVLSVLSSLFTFPRIDMFFPFIHPQKPELQYNGVILNSDTLVGVFSYPVMFFLFLLGAVKKQMMKKDTLLFPFCVSGLAAAVCICITDSAFAITNRYLTDYLFLLSLIAVMVLFCIWESLETEKSRLAAEYAILFAGSVGFALFVCLSLTGEGDWFHLINPACYDKLRYSLSPWL